MSHRTKLYELYDGPYGYTTRTRWYGIFTHNVYRVRAKNVLQAKVILENKIWAPDHKYTIGIKEIK